VESCRHALAADPGHLEAAWLLAAALGRLGQHAALVPPLQLAVAGDFGTWGHASLELPALASFLATPAGEAWRDRVAQDRGTYLAALARAVIVTAAGDLYAFDPEATRWHRLTRTSGAVLGAIPVPTRASSGGVSGPATHRIVYVTRQRVGSVIEVAVGLIDLARGRTSRPVGLGTPGPVSIAYSTRAHPGVWIGTPPRKRTRPITWRRLDDAGTLVPLPKPTVRPAGAWLEITERTAKLRAPPVANVTADWDEHGLASAIRIGNSHRIVAVPSPGLIHGSSVTWAADRARLAFVAQLSDECTPDALVSAAFVADAATGRLQEVERAARGLAVEWVTDRTLAVAGDGGVSLVDLAGGPPVPLEGADGLVSPRQRATCTPSEPDAGPREPVDVPMDVLVEDPDPDPASGGAPGEIPDAGVTTAR
nr:hypothetical protein [Myxococcota bacterium]